MVAAQPFVIKSLNNSTLPVADKKMVDEFSRKVSELRRVSSAANNYREELVNKIKFIKTALIDAPNSLQGLTDQVYAIEKRLVDVDTKLNGDASLVKREFEISPSIKGRIGALEGSLWNSTSEPTQTAKQSYEVASKQFEKVLTEIKSIDGDIKKIETSLEQSKAPYTPGRIPVVIEK